VLLKTIEGLEPAEFRTVVNRANLNSDTAKAEIEAMTSSGQVIALGGSIRQSTRLYTAAGWRALEDLASSSLGEYHRLFPLRSGAPREELRSRLRLSPQVFNDVMKRFNEAGVISLGESTVRLPDHTPSLADGQRKMVDGYLRRLDSDPFSPPTDIPIDSEVVNLLDDEGKVVKVSETVVFSASAYQDMVDRISAHLGERGEITVADVRDLLGTSRKYALALMDHLDHVRVTRRVGDVRVLR
jgi:selenocysteine-specific elongation factor